MLLALPLWFRIVFAYIVALVPSKSPALGGDFWLTLRCGVAGGRGRFDAWAWEPIELDTPDM